MKILKVLITGVIVAVLLSSCFSDHYSYLNKKRGKPCIVQLKRNALGCAAQLPVSPLTSNINGADVAIYGTLKKVDKDAVTIINGKTTYWIPKDSILLIQFDS
jgi:hypothetical protein